MRTYHTNFGTNFVLPETNLFPYHSIFNFHLKNEVYMSSAFNVISKSQVPVISISWEKCAKRVCKIDIINSEEE